MSLPLATQQIWARRLVQIRASAIQTRTLVSCAISFACARTLQSNMLVSWAVCVRSRFGSSANVHKSSKTIIWKRAKDWAFTFYCCGRSGIVATWSRVSSPQTKRRCRCTPRCTFWWAIRCWFRNSFCIGKDNNNEKKGKWEDDDDWVSMNW